MEQVRFNEIWTQLIALGYGAEIDWQRNLKECDNNIDFYHEAVWVILNSGMKEQIARKISERIYAVKDTGGDISTVFKHKGKVAAIKHVWANSGRLFAEYVESTDKIEYLQTIPFIGKITCWHLAKNLGHDCVKPDRHLVRVASEYGMTPNEMCNLLSAQTGEKKSVIDIIIWRACNLKLI